MASQRMRQRHTPSKPRSRTMDIRQGLSPHKEINCHIPALGGCEILASRTGPKAVRHRAALCHCRTKESAHLQNEGLYDSDVALGNAASAAIWLRAARALRTAFKAWRHGRRCSEWRSWSLVSQSSSCEI